MAMAGRCDGLAVELLTRWVNLRAGDYAMGQDKRNDREKLLRLLTATVVFGTRRLSPRWTKRARDEFIRLVEKQREGAGADWHQIYASRCCATVASRCASFS